MDLIFVLRQMSFSFSGILSVQNVPRSPLLVFADIANTSGQDLLLVFAESTASRFSFSLLVSCFSFLFSFFVSASGVVLRCWGVFNSTVPRHAFWSSMQPFLSPIVQVQIVVNRTQIKIAKNRNATQDDSAKVRKKSSPRDATSAKTGPHLPDVLCLPC